MSQPHFFLQFDSMPFFGKPKRPKKENDLLINYRTRIIAVLQMDNPNASDYWNINRLAKAILLNPYADVNEKSLANNVLDLNL
jgi:hypothetical protein